MAYVEIIFKQWTHFRFTAAYIHTYLCFNIWIDQYLTGCQILSSRLNSTIYLIQYFPKDIKTNVHILIHRLITYISTYIIGHYNHSVRITTYMGINFIHEWRDLEFFLIFNILPSFLSKFSWQFYFTLRVFARNLLRGSRRKNIFSYFVLNRSLTST